jgi:hypothetical protein
MDIYKDLKKGPRGGGRELDGIVQHVLQANDGYLRRLGITHKTPETITATAVAAEVARTQDAIAAGLNAAVRGELPTTGPRGGAQRAPRYFVRRVGWHILDHTWEIENRVID